MAMLSHVHQLFSAEHCQAYIHTLRWKDRLLQCPRCHSTRSIRGASTTTGPGVNATGARVASAPSTTSPRPCCTRARGRWHTGSLPPFCCASPVRPGALRERWGSMSGPAIAGAGGYAMPPCRMRCTANWRGRWKRMTSTTLPAIRGKRKGAGRRRWDASHVAVGRNASPGVAIMALQEGAQRD